MTCFGFVLFPELEELDFAGPWEMIGSWSKHFGGPDECLTVAEVATPVVAAKGLSLNPHAVFATCPPLDYLLVPGGIGTRTQVDNPALVRFIAERAATCKAVLSVCTGAFLLERAGLLAGKRATTHWASLDRLRACAQVDVVEERFVRTGNVWTSAGVSAGTDMALAFIADVAGDDVAGKVQLYSEWYPSTRRYGSAHRDPGAPGYVRERA
jgi:transcriptional regulator GlxA family with amidase domain